MIRKNPIRNYVRANLIRAIDEGWIKVYHQPLIRAANNMVCDEEALARWCDPTHGIILPDQFVSVYEEEGLSSTLDLFMIRKTIEKMQSQRDAGLYMVPESVNLSKTDFFECDMVSEVINLMDSMNFDHSKLAIEISENAIGMDFPFMGKIIRRFREQGVRVWLDNFGKGLSSPFMPEKIGFDAVKFDISFMQHFEDSKNERIILTQLIKMFISLGVDTIAEGIETADQAKLLKEIGCTKLQGNYFCPPVSLEALKKNNERGTMIEFENPDETAYFEAIGRINLYDISVADDDDPVLNDYFDTLPMVILEANDEGLSYVRKNPAHNEFISKHFPSLIGDPDLKYSSDKNTPGYKFIKAAWQCVADGKRVVVDELAEDGCVIQFFIRRVAINPVNDSVALAVIILGMPKKQDDSINYSYIAKALSSDYINLYFVNLSDSSFVEYTPDPDGDDISIERRGEGFFESFKENTLKYIYYDDKDEFKMSFTKDKIKEAIDSENLYNLTYRIFINDTPTYVNLKAVRVGINGTHLIVGISNIDSQMKQRELQERIRNEEITYNRISALSGDFICIYTVDPETDHYTEYISTDDYAGLGLSKEGDDFFKKAKEYIKRVIYSKDVSRVESMINKDQMLDQMMGNGVFLLNYRLMINDVPTYVCLKAALIQEKDGSKIIVGISNIDAQVRQSQEYAKNLSLANERANIDELTGVKNKHAYVDEELRINAFIENRMQESFAIALFDLNGLKDINDTLGHQAGDRFICDGCRIICHLFAHSPVYRVGGDEFAVIATGSDYESIDDLMNELAVKNEENKKTNNVVIAGGYARFENERNVSAVFERADRAMYKNKAELKK